AIVETRLGVATSSPLWALTVADTSRPQFALVDGTAGSSAYTFRSSAGTLYIATSSPSATSTIPSFTIDTNGSVGIGTSSPATQLAASGLLFVGAGGQTNAGIATSTFYGDVKIAGKLDVSTIDPVYSIDGVKYATYGASQIGVKEELSFVARPREL